MVRGKECVLGPGSVSHSTFTQHSRPCYPISSTHSTPWDLRELLYLGVVVVRGLRSVHGYRDMQPKHVIFLVRSLASLGTISVLPETSINPK